MLLVLCSAVRFQFLVFALEVTTKRRRRIEMIVHTSVQGLRHRAAFPNAVSFVSCGVVMRLVDSVRYSVSDDATALLMINDFSALRLMIGLVRFL